MINVIDEAGNYYILNFSRTMDQTTTTPPPGWTIDGKPLLTLFWVTGTLAHVTTTPTMAAGLPYVVTGGTTIHTATGGPVEPSTGTTIEDD